MYGIGILNDYDLAEQEEEPLTHLTGGGGAKSGQVGSFKNGSVLRVVVSYDSIEVSMVVGGEIGEGEDKPGYTYFVPPDTPYSSHSYREIPFHTVTIQNRFYDADVIENGDEFEFYLIRHGQAEHNVLKGISKAFSNKDTSLTKTGIEQARRTGQSLYNAISNSNGIYGMPTRIFASDLKRTRQTLSEVMTWFRTRSIDTITILPCAHELRYKVNKDTMKCDGSKIPSAAENVMNCTKERCDFEYEYKNNWDDYYNFYGNTTRNSLIKTCSTCTTRHCRDTDMIKEAIVIINSEEKDMRTAIYERDPDVPDNFKSVRFEGGERQHHTRRKKQNNRKKQKSKKKRNSKKKQNSKKKRRK